MMSRTFFPSWRAACTLILRSWAVVSSIALAQSPPSSEVTSSASSSTAEQRPAPLDNKDPISDLPQNADELRYGKGGAVEKKSAKQLNELAQTYFRTGQYARAEPLFVSALAIAEKLEGPAHPSTGMRMNNLALLYVAMGQYTRAEPLYVRALAIAEKSDGPEHPNTGIRLNNLALLYRLTGRYARAEPLHVRALAIAEKFDGPEHPSTGIRLNNLALMYRLMGQYARAEPLHVRALKIAEKAEGPEHPSTGTRLNNLAELYRSTGQYARAEPLYMRALAIAEKSEGPAHPNTGMRLNNLALLYASLGQYARAEPLYERALAIAEKSEGPEHPNTGKRVNNLAELYRLTGQYARAEPLYVRALAIAARNADSPLERFSAQRNYARMLYQGFQRTADKGALAAKAQRDQAIFFAKLAVNTFQGVRDNAKGLEPDMQQSLLETNQTVYQRLADWLIEAGRLVEAEQVLAMLKQNELQELTRRSGDAVLQVAMTGPEKAQANSYNTFSVNGVRSAQALAALDVRAKQDGSLSAADTAERERLKVEAATQRAAVLAFLNSIQAKLSADPAAAQRDRDGLEKNTRALQTVVRQADEATTSKVGHIGLQYVVTDERLSVIVSLPNASFSRQVPMKREVLNRQVLALREALKSAQYDALPAAKALYASLLAPIESELRAANAHTLVLSLSDLLRYVPFAALHDGERYLGERYALALHTPAGGQAVSRATAALWQVAGMGLTQEASIDEGGLQRRKFKALDSVRDEVHGIVKVSTGPGAGTTSGVLPGEVWLDPAFTRERFERALARFPVLHISSHFHFTPGSESMSYLVMGDQSALTLADLKEMDFNGVQLLTLSACDTANGGGRTERGSEVEGLAAAVQLQGAKAVLATLWQVADISTALLMRRFYELRVQRPELTTAQALQAASLELKTGRLKGNASLSAAARAAKPVCLDNGKDVPCAQTPVFAMPDGQPFAHPYYWAPFVLMGNWL